MLKESALQIAAHHCDKLKVREEGGANRGPMVDQYLQVCGIGPGYPWCAAFVTYCLVKAGASLQVLPKHPASTYYWMTWAMTKGILTNKPELAERGDLFIWNESKGNAVRVGHIGFIVETRKWAGVWWLRTIEGNSNDNGSREGTKVVRKGRQGLPGVLGWRRVTSKIRFIRLPSQLRP